MKTIVWMLLVIALGGCATEKGVSPGGIANTQPTPSYYQPKDIYEAELKNMYPLPYLEHLSEKERLELEQERLREEQERLSDEQDRLREEQERQASQ
jgi:hypothetical protein